MQEIGDAGSNESAQILNTELSVLWNSIKILVYALSGKENIWWLFIEEPHVCYNIRKYFAGKY